MSALTYPERGATAHRPLPAGYHHLHHRTLVGHGRTVFEAAGAAVTTFRMHRRAGVRIRADRGRAEPGGTVELAVGFGPLRIVAPCEVVWTVYGSDRTGSRTAPWAGIPSAARSRSSSIWRRTGRCGSR